MGFPVGTTVKFVEASEEPGTLQLFAEDGSRIGFVGYTLDPDFGPIVLYIEVAREVRRQGIGSSLLVELASRLDVPLRKLEPGLTTPDGEQLLQALRARPELTTGAAAPTTPATAVDSELHPSL